MTEKDIYKQILIKLGRLRAGFKRGLKDRFCGADKYNTKSLLGGDMGSSHPKSGETNGFKTLIVEDNASFRLSLKESLETLFPSIIVQEAAEGVEALQKVESFLPQLIFMDIHLPGENGLQLTKKIKAAYPVVPIIILTNYDIPEYREAAFQYGANSFIPKDSLDWGQIESLVKSFYRF